MKWLRTVYNAVKNIGEIYLYGVITDEKWTDSDVVPMELKKEIDKFSKAKSLNMYINSPGGDVFSGMAIYNMLQRLSTDITAYVDGMSASIASVIMMAAKKIVVPPNAMVMIHNPTVMVVGGVDEMQKAADLLARVKDNIVGVYADKTKLPPEKISELMDNETWMNGNEALELGFATEVSHDVKLAACFNGSSIIVNGLAVETDRFRAFKPEKYGVTHLDRCQNAENRLKILKLNQLGGQA